MRTPIVAFATGLVLAAGAAVRADPPADLGVNRIALFSSGVGYFERNGTVSADATSELNFRTDQINDILKSLVVQDFDGGSVGVVSYASRDPIEKALKSFGVDITAKPTLAQLLDQLRGEPVEVTSPRAAKGVIVGVEKRKQAVKDQIVETDVLNLLTPDGLVQFDIAGLGGIRLTNEKVDAELRKALATLATGHDADKKSVVLSFNGKGERRVRAAYLLEAPIWKTSYRLVLSPEKKPFLQGWATVENATEEDWKDVKLSLVSGRPISFRMDLYTPLYIPRPIEQLELYASLRPPEFEGGFAEEAKKAVEKLADRKPAAPPAAMAPGRRGAGKGGGGRFGAVAADAEAIGREPMEMSAGVELDDAGVASVATAQEAGELFEYAIQTPVSIPRQHSAMLPIVNMPIDGDKVSIYNPATHPKHPLNGLELKNTTDLHLMQGPITLFDGNVYAGDAKLPDIKPGEKRLVAYALDLSVEVMVRSTPTPDELVSVRIGKGVLYHRHRYVDARTYDLKNKADRERTIIIEQPFVEPWRLVEPKEPYERTQNLVRFKTGVPAGQTAAFKVTSERVGDVSIILAQCGLDEIRQWLQVKVVTPAVKQALEQIVKLRTAHDDAARRRAALEQSVNEAVQEQGRVRENLKTLTESTDARQRQLRKFDELETQIEKLRGEIVAARQDEEAKRKALEDFLLNLDVD